MLFAIFLPMAGGMSAQAPSSQGFSYEFSISSNPDSKTGEFGSVTTGTFFARDGNMRWNYPDKPEQRSNKYIYLLAHEGGKRVYYVNSKVRQFYELVEGEFEERGSLAREGLKTKASDAKIELERVGPGPEISGYSTIEFRMKQRMTITLSKSVRSIDVDESSTVTFLVAPELKDYASASNHPRWLEFPLKNMGAEYDRALDTVIKVIAREGRILKMDWVSLLTGPGWPQEPIRVLFEAKNVSVKSVADSIFVIPDSYKKLDHHPQKISPRFRPPPRESPRKAPSDRPNPQSGQAFL